MTLDELIEELTRLREAFDTDARIAHRLLSQRAAQHDAILATLNLLQPGADGGQPQQRLPALYPQVLAVLQRERGRDWPDADLQAADAQSRALGRAVPVRIDLAQGRCLLLQHGEPASHALRAASSARRAVVAAVPWSFAVETTFAMVSICSSGCSFALRA